MPKYRYAYDKTGRVVDIFQLTQNRSELSDKFICFGCGESLIAKIKGEQREKHFAHKVVNASCTEETYIHKLAKETFFEEFSRCMESEKPFTIELTYPKICSKFEKELGHSCQVGTLTKAYDLTQYYNRIRLEKKDGEFVPDLIIFNAKDEKKKVYIEMAVTHFLSEKKEKSGNRIIEIPIETQSDIDKFRERKLTKSNANFFNFDEKSYPATDAECNCAMRAHYCFFVYKSGKCFLDYDSLAKIEAKRNKLSKSIKYSRVILTDTDYNSSWFRASMFEESVIEAHRWGLLKKNCFLCRYSGVGYIEAIFCKFLKKECGSNEAVACQYFRTDYAENRLQTDGVCDGDGVIP